MKRRKGLGALLGLLLLAGTLQALSYEVLHQSVGDQFGDRYGNTVAIVGDLNGDGYADLAVGAPEYHDTGAVFLFFGPSAVYPDLVLMGDDNGSDFGAAVAGAGDVNNDGYDDLIVGAPYYTETEIGQGAAYLFYGGAAMDALSDLKMVGPQNRAWFGFSVAGAGDVNNDGYDDLIVGAPGMDVSGKTNAGAAYIFLGASSSSMDTTPDWQTYGQGAGDFYGFSVAGLGHLDNDNYDDVVVGAPYYDQGSSSDVGAAYVFLGGDPIDPASDFDLVGEATGDHFGYAVAGPGDIDGDGTTEVLVGAPDHVVGGYSNSGAAYLYWGGLAMDLVYDVKFVGDRWARFGFSVAGAGDVNGDGYRDLIIGGPTWEENGQSWAGAAYLFLGGVPMDSVPDLRMEGTQVFGQLGVSVSGGGDFNGNGFDDVAVGADSAGTNHEGQAWVYQFRRFRLLSPTGGETWTVGARKTIRWLGRDSADLYLSVDGGATWTPLAQNLRPPFPMDTMTFTLQVPQVPTRYALVRVTLHGETTPDPLHFAQSDTFFTINATITLLAFNAETGEEGKVRLSWQTDPGPEDLVGYHVYRLNADGTETRLTAEPIQGQAYEDEATAGVRGYALGAVNGLGTEYRLGELLLGEPRHLVVLTPTLVRGDRVQVHYVVPLSGDRGSASVEIRLVDRTGRVHARRQRIQIPGTYVDEIPVGGLKSGMYFVEVRVGDAYRETHKLLVLR